ncbi:hypothetical protein NQ314_009965 [Rhamnusium bicolor]|uniref:MICOS complex subunit MIC60 n=1 Tax=Rhamnusium bicolor TaxID=1586634 RepID=A0AAV8XVP8_9CUCU|nr:hypothetical protein NQ314_009965 [Rhamnusium bicolor]
MLRVVRKIPDKKGALRTQQLLEFKLYRSVNYHSSKGRTVVALGALAFAGGATLTYAKYDSDFRKTLTDYAPFTDTLIKTFLKATILSLLSGSKGKIVELPPEPSEYKAPPPILPVLEKDVKKAATTYSEIRLEKKEKEDEEPKVEIVGDVKPIVSEAIEADSVNLGELEEKIRVSAEEAVNAYNRAIYIIKSYNQDIEYIIDEAVNEVKPSTWDSVKKKAKDKAECVRRAEEKAAEATKDINKLKDLVSRAKKELDLEQKQGSVTEKYWDKVEKARCHFSEELESLFPSIDLTKKEMRVNSEDLDLFKVKQAVEAARKGGGEVLTNAQICEAVDQEKRRLTLCFQQQVLKLRKEAETELREQLKRQSQAFHDHLAEAIRIREQEIERTLARKYDELLESERCRFKMQLSTVIGRLRGLDVAVKDKIDADEAARQAQVLWSACQALLRAIKAGCPGLAWKDQIRPLEPEITAVKRAAAQNDELVSVVINGIPVEAKERGVYPEDALRERFLKVEQVARTVALVPEEGAKLPIHILSYLQSLLYWLDRGDFAQTLKYMNLLKGAPRCVARQWMNETRILLETQQAANTLMAHAASSGLTHL